MHLYVTSFITQNNFSIPKIFFISNFSKDIFFIIYHDTTEWIIFPLLLTKLEK